MHVGMSTVFQSPHKKISDYEVYRDGLRMADLAEPLGFESIWYAEHPIMPVSTASPFPATGGAVPETYAHFTAPYIALAQASGVTSTIKLGTGITLVPERNPLLLAKEIATLDILFLVPNPTGFFLPVPGI